ncbi:MAG: type II toxin-antitoxin system VapC family toxin [Eubacteriales bacterium]
MRTSVDTNVLIVLLRGKPEEQAQLVADALTDYDRQGQLLICPPVWSELKILIGERKLNSFLKDNRVLVDWDLSPEIWSEAAGAFSRYLENRRRSGSLHYCSGCGKEIVVECPRCAKPQGFPRHVLPDFLICAHALYRADVLLTADKGIPPKYFTGLKVFNPLEKPPE